MPRNAYFDVPPYESLVEKHPDFFIRLVMVILFSIAQILCHNNLEKLGAWEDVDAALLIGPKNRAKIRIRAIWPKWSKFSLNFLFWSKKRRISCFSF